MYFIFIKIRSVLFCSSHNEANILNFSNSLSDTHQDGLRLVFRAMVEREVRKLRPEVGFEPTTFGSLSQLSYLGHTF